MSSKSKVTSIRATGQAPEPRLLPDEARQQLATLVTEVHGAAMVLRAEVVLVEEEDDTMYAAVSMWLDRIARDLGAMEIQRYPLAAEVS